MSWQQHSPHTLTKRNSPKKLKVQNKKPVKKLRKKQLHQQRNNTKSSLFEQKRGFISRFCVK